MTSNNLQHLSPADPVYPVRLSSDWAGEPLPDLTIIGNATLLHSPLLAFFCSTKCPGSLILQSHDLAHRLRNQDTPMIGGFHSPVEKEVLTVLIGGTQPIVHCPARSIETMRIGREFNAALADDRLLFVSPFRSHQKRATKETSRYRNRLVAALADWVFIAYADAGGSVEGLAQPAIRRGKAVYTFNSEHTANLRMLGAQSIRSDDRLPCEDN